MAFDTVLVALDQSPQANSVFQQTLDLVNPDGLLIIFHGLDLDLSGHTGPFMGIGTLADVDVYSSLKHQQRDHVKQQVDAAQAWLAQFGQMAEERGIQSECICHVGKPGDWICDLAQNRHADLIVVGRRGRSGIAELMLGSVSNHVVHNARCAVLVIQGQTNLDTANNSANTSTMLG
jgi:nucleotide-binding universal stress UspA family protein